MGLVIVNSDVLGDSSLHLLQTLSFYPVEQHSWIQGCNIKIIALPSIKPGLSPGGERGEEVKQDWESITGNNVHAAPQEI